MLLKCCTQHVSIFEKLSSGHRTGQGQFLSQSQFCVKFRSCVQKVNYTHSIRSLFNNQCWKHTSLGSQGQRSWTALSLSTCMSTLNHFTKQNISHTMKTEHFSHLLKLSFSLIFASLTQGFLGLSSQLPIILFLLSSSHHHPSSCLISILL